MGEYGDVRYTVMVVVERPWRPNAKSEPFPFIVVRPVDLNLEPAEFRVNYRIYTVRERQKRCRYKLCTTLPPTRRTRSAEGPYCC